MSMLWSAPKRVAHGFKHTPDYPPCDSNDDTTIVGIAYLEKDSPLLGIGSRDAQYDAQEDR